MDISFSVTLPCGCEVRNKHTLVGVSDAAPTPQEVRMFFENATDVVSYWYEARFFKDKRHQCDLVSETNPLGLTPKES